LLLLRVFKVVICPIVSIEHVERKDVEDWVSKYRRLEVEGCRDRGRPKKTWEQRVKCDIGCI